MRDKTLEDYLDSAEGAGKVLAHARLLLKLSRLYQNIAPAYLSEISRLVNYKAGTVVIHAANGAAAAKLRQLSATLADGFSRRGIECAAIQVKVGVGEPLPRRAVSRQKPLSGQAFRTLGALRETLSDPDLRQAVDTLIQRSAKA